MPDSTVCNNYEFFLPIQLEISVDDSIIAYQMSINYNSTLIEIHSASSKGALTENWGSPYFNAEEGEFRVAAFSAEFLYLNADGTPDTMLFVKVRVLKDIECTTGIHISEVSMYNSMGELNVEAPHNPVSRLNLIHNEAPVITSVPDIEFFEDSTYTLNVESFIKDADHSIDQLHVFFQPEQHLNSVYSSQYDLIINPLEDWSGTEYVIISVRDPYNYTDSDTVKITVNPLDDPPQKFVLLNPKQDSLLQSGINEIEFQWQRSKNVDINDSISYTFYLGKDSTFQTDILNKYTSLRKELILLTLSLQAGRYFWGVFAEDMQDNCVWCDEVFSFYITSGVDYPEDNLVEEFKLFQNYPNPFNSQTCIRFQLPKPANVKILIYDAVGRYIKTLISGYFETGNHSIMWNALDQDDNPLSSGVYFIWFKMSNRMEIRKVVFVK